MNVTYLTGELNAKRKMIRSMSEDAVIADNDDIIGYFRLSGKLYCLPGTLPFSDMSIQALAHKRQVQGDVVARSAQLSQSRRLQSEDTAQSGLSFHNAIPPPVPRIELQGGRNSRISQPRRPALYEI